MIAMVIDRDKLNLETPAIGPTLAILRDAVLFFYLTVIFSGNISAPLEPRVLTPLDISKVGQGAFFWQFIGVMLLCVGIGLQSRGSWRKFSRVLWPYWPIIIWIFLSVIWSDFPYISGRRVIRFFIEVTALICFATAYQDQYRLLRVVFLSFGFIVLLDVALLATSASYTPIGYAGIHDHKNQAGLLCFLALPVFLSAIFDPRIFPGRWIPLGLSGLCLAILALSLSKTAWGLTPICPLLAFGLLSLGRMPPVNMIVAVVISGLGAAIALALVTSIGFSDFLAATIDDPSLTHRDRLWKYTLYRFSQAPIIGHGYGALWEVNANSSLQPREFGVSFYAEQAHNGYLDILAQLGIVGLILTILLMLGIIVLLVRKNQVGWTPGFIAMYTTVGILLYNITESSLLRAGSEIWLYFVLLVSNAVMPSNRRALVLRSSS